MSTRATRNARPTRGRPRRPPAVAVATVAPDEGQDQDQQEQRHDYESSDSDTGTRPGQERAEGGTIPETPDTPESRPSGKERERDKREREIGDSSKTGEREREGTKAAATRKSRAKAVQAEVLDHLADTLKHCQLSAIEKHLTPDESRTILSALARDATREETRLRAIELDARIAGYQAPTRAVTGQFVFSGHTAEARAQAEAAGISLADSAPAGLLASAGDPATLAKRVEAWRIRRQTLRLTTTSQDNPDTDNCRAGG